MAEVWKVCNAKSKGERRLATHLSGLDDPRLILTFSLDFIPGGREIDLLLIHQNIGVFVVEVKAVGIDAIKSVSPSEWVIDQRVTKENPVTQAYCQYEGLRDFLSPHFQHLPFIAVTACLPLISRRQWTNTFGHSVYANEIADRMLFEEDLYSGMPTFIDRLHFIHKNPPARKGREVRGVSDKFLTFLQKAIIEPATPVRPTMSEQDRLAAIERGITSKVHEEFPPDAICRAVFSGYPGTGKTFRLLSIGALHAYAGKRVLFVCFNKTLGSDIRRLLSFSERLKASDYAIEVLDISQLTLRCFDMNGLGLMGSTNADEWGRMVFDELDGRESPSIERYDTILIDEAQDMKEWHLDILGLHTRTDSSSVLIAMGQGQELYKDPASATDWLQAFTLQNGIRSHQLNRNFRNPREQYFFAQAFFDAWPTNFEKIEVCKKKLLGKSKQELLFDRPGNSPKYISLPVRNDEFDDHGRWQDEIVAQAFFDVVDDEFEEISKNENFHPVSLLILVPGPDGFHCRVARLALDRLCREKGIEYIDYTKEESRRASAMQNQIRLCTFHSARGLEGERVVVFGLDDVEKVALAAGAAPQNLAFVALSRGLFTTTIVVRSAPRNAVHTLCEKILQALA